MSTNITTTINSGNLPKTLTDRFYKDTNNCWIWTGTRFNTGYGSTLNSKGILLRAEKVVYEAVNGKVPEGKALHHKNPNGNACPKCCVNPEHLEAFIPAPE